MEPGHEAREDLLERQRDLGRRGEAAMEPGHEDREDSSPVSLCALPVVPQWSPVTKTGKTGRCSRRGWRARGPQWSPVTKTGKTRDRHRRRGEDTPAAMEPGHEDREDTHERAGVDVVV